MDIAYADHRDDRMIILGRYEFPTIEYQDQQFDALSSLPDSDFIVDYYDADGNLTKDKCVSEETVEFVTGHPVAEMIRRGRIREAALSRSFRNALAKLRRDRAA